MGAMVAHHAAFYLGMVFGECLKVKVRETRFRLEVDANELREVM